MGVTSIYKKTDCRFDYSSTVRSAGDYGAHLNTPKTLEECEALCDAHPECASFVVDQMGGGKCHLRTECPLVKQDCEASAPTSLPDDLPSDIPSGSPSYAPSLSPITSSPSMQKATSSNKVCQCMAEGAHLRVFHAPKGYIWVHQQGYLPRNVQRYAPIQSFVLLIPKIKAHFVICVSRLT